VNAGIVRTHHDVLKLFFKFLEDEDELPSPVRRGSAPERGEVDVRP
jgi:hypothetical protein